MNDDATSASKQLADQALEEAQEEEMANVADGDDEAEASDKLADTLFSLQNIIERNADTLEELKQELKHKREALRNIFENDPQLADAKQQAQTYTTQVKDRKSKLQADPEATSLKVQIGEINEKKKELEESLSNHLINYHKLTDSTSFDTKDGDQWEFVLKAKVKGKPKSN